MWYVEYYSRDVSQSHHAKEKEKKKKTAAARTADHERERERDFRWVRRYMLYHRLRELVCSVYASSGVDS